MLSVGYLDGEAFFFFPSKSGFAINLRINAIKGRTETWGFWELKSFQVRGEEQSVQAQESRLKRGGSKYQEWSGSQRQKLEEVCRAVAWF